MKTLNVKHTNMTEIVREWGFSPVPIPGWDGGPLFIRCNAKGEINWDKAPVYTYKELIIRNNVNIL